MCCASRAGENVRGNNLTVGPRNRSRNLRACPPLLSLLAPGRAGVMAEAAAGGEAMAAAEGSSGPAGLFLGRGFSNYRPFEPQALGLSPSWRLTGFSGMKG